MTIKLYILILKEEREGLTSRKRSTHIRSLTPQINSFIKNLTLQGDSRSFRKVKEEKRILHPTNVTIVTIWDILLIIFQLEEKNTRREIKGTMPMQLKMKSHPRRCLKKRLNTMP
jgi:hypothetical protein